MRALFAKKTKGKKKIENIAVDQENIYGLPFVSRNQTHQYLSTVINTHELLWKSRAEPEAKT